MEVNETPEQSTEGTQVGNDIVMPAEPTEDPVVTNERAAFVRYVKEQGESIPANFKSAEDWFNSLKQAQGEYTKSRQEIAELKKNYNETAVSNPNYDPQAERQPAAEPVVEDVSDVPEELQITKPAEPEYGSVGAEDWTRWGKEIDQSGDLSEATKKEVAKRLNADPIVVEQMVRGRQAMQKQAFDSSASVVGGADNLKRILKWAGENLPAEEISAMNQGLQGPASQSILMGLQARFQSSTATQETQPEPAVSTPNAMTGKPAKPGPEAQAFVSELEMKAAIADPRYRTDPAFRQAVEQRIVLSHQHGYKGR
tara:strand:- start:7410 stop:8345 length:936 start_codon:yes stop_codon:yes gene_type:complete